MELPLDRNSHGAEGGKQTASTVLPPFSEKLTKDTALKLSNDDFKRSIKQFYANKQLSIIDQLKTTPPYPTPHVFAQFANMAYRDCKHGDPDTPNGWQLLTTASNFAIKNGYFGAAYWHPEHQQLVIAHRGTDITSVGAIVTDVEGVVFNNYVDQMSSASTFANKVVTVLQEIEQEMKVSFELFFTGHSLGGWLAQITAFTTEYLEEKGGTFLKKMNTGKDAPLTKSTVEVSHVVTHSYHPHTVVFDSPGCKDMLSQMTDKLDVRLHGRSIDLERLDITSYLSAPNRINTCNSHLGTVYRIFIDLSDMGIIEEYTPLYNLATHKMDKIVKAFDPETGQVRKDNKGELKIREVVDWPVSADVLGGAELNHFFNWAKKLNEYNPDLKDISYSNVPKGYHPFRYQTKDCNECTKRLSTFNQDEREFLQRYRWLRQVPEFFKPEGLFRVLNNVEVENKAQRMLQNFELDNESVRCRLANTLCDLIPFVKRLINLFPHIKEKLQEQFPLLKIRDRIYQHETKCYVEKIDQSALDFNPGALDVREFLDSDQQIWLLRMIDGDAWTGLIKVYQVLQNTEFVARYFSEGHYTILELERLLTVNRMVNLNALLTSMETPHLLMIACGTNQTVNDELRDMFKELFNILKGMNNIKMILTTKSEDSTSAILQQIASKTLDKGVKTTDEMLTWNELTPNSQRKLLGKKVIFQGRQVTLNQLTFAEAMADSFPLSDLLQENELRIGGEPVPSTSSGYNEKYYIDRTFNHNIVISLGIQSDKRKDSFADLLASTEQEFKLLCQQNPTSNIHWLVEEESELIWRQSQGNLKKLRKYIHVQKSQSYAPSELDNLLKQAKEQKFMLISDTAGMGKSTVLTHLSKRIKEKSPEKWLVRIDLNDYTDLLKDQKGKKMDKEGVLEFLSQEVLKLESHIEKELFRVSFEDSGTSKLVVMVDGFDEISPDYKQTVIDMLHVLKQTSVEQLWVTTRPHLREELEDNLQQLSYTLQPFSEFEQIHFLEKFWTENLNIGVANQHRLQIYAKALIRKLAQSISDKDKQFTGIPLQIHMLAEAFGKKFTSFYTSEQSEPELPQKLGLVKLYRRFIEIKYEIFHNEKNKIQANIVGPKKMKERYYKTIQLEHQLLALKALFTENQVTFLKSDNHYAFSDEEMARIGIVQRKNGAKPQFIHRTFAEFYVAEWLMNFFTKESKQLKNVQDFLVNKILLESEYRVIRSFLDGLLEKSKPSKEVLRQFGEKLDEMWNETKVRQTKIGYPTALHIAATDDNANIIGLLLDSLKSGEFANTVREMLLARDYDKNTAWVAAAETNSSRALKKIWDWNEAVTSTLIYSLLLSQDKNKKTAWQLAAEGGHIEMVEKLWGWAKQAKIHPGELLNKLILEEDTVGKTSWHVAAQRGSLQLIEKLWFWAKEELNNTDLLKCNLLLSRDKHGVNAWHQAARTGGVEILGKLWDWSKEVPLNIEDLRNEILLSEDQCGQTCWHKAAEEGHVEVLVKLWDWAKDVKLNSDCLKVALFLQEDSRAFNTWCLALNNGHIYVLEKLWGWAEDLQLTIYELNKLLLAVDRDGNTAIYWASGMGNVELLEKMWRVCSETQLYPDYVGKFLVVAWHRAAAGGYVEKLERLWLWAGEVNPNTQDFKERLLLGQNKDGESVWHTAATEGHVDVLDKLWEWTIEQKLNLHDLKRVLFLPEECGGFSTWCYAIRGARVDVLHKLWGWAEKLQLTRDELKNKLFLAVDRFGNSAIYWATRTGNSVLLETVWDLSKEEKLKPDELRTFLVAAWHEAAAGGNLEILERLWMWTGKVQRNPHVFKSRLLLEINKTGKSVWHLAAARGDTEVLEKLWDWAKREQMYHDLLDDKIAWYPAVKRAVVVFSLCLPDDKQTNVEDLRCAILLARDRLGNNPWHLAVNNGKIMVLEKILDYAKEIKLNPSKVWNELFLNQEDDVRSAWFLAAKRSNVKVLQELWNLVKENGNPEETKSKFLLAQNESGETALHLAATGSVAVLEKLWAFAKETQLKEDELNNKLLLVKDKYGYTAWHRAADGGNSEALDTLLNWGKKSKLNADELKNNFLLAQNEKGETCWDLAVEGNYEVILQKMWNCAKELQVNSEQLQNKLLLAKDKSGNTVWHRAAKRGCLEALETLRSWGKKVKIIPHELLLTQNQEGETSWTLAAQNNNLVILETMWDWIKLYSKEMKETLLLGKDWVGYTAWHQAAEGGCLEAIETLWSLTKNAELNTDELLLTRTWNGYTAFHLAAANNHVEILKKLWKWAEKTQLDPKEMKAKMLLATNKNGHIAWHRAAEKGNLEALKILWRYSKEVELKTHLLLLAQNTDGYTAFHLAAEKNHVDTLKKLWMWAEGKVHKTRLKKKMLRAINKYGSIAWHRAAYKGSVEALQALWSWAMEVGLDTDDLLLAKDGDGYTAFHLAAENNHVETLQNLWVWAEESRHNQKELKAEMLLTKNKYGYTAWHTASGTGSLEALQALWIWSKQAGVKTDELLLAKNGDENTAFYLAAENNHVVTLQKLSDWAEETEHGQKALKKNMLLAINKKGQTAWHRAAGTGSLEDLQVLWSWATQAGLKTDELLLAKNGIGCTAFHLAAEYNHLDKLKQLWSYAAETQLDAKEMKKKLFLAENKYGSITWHRAAAKGSLKVLETLWNVAKDVEIKTDELLLTKSGNGYTTFYFAAKNNHLETLKKLWVWTEETQQNPKELKKKLLLARDRDGKTVWQALTLFSTPEILEILKNFVSEAELNPLELL